MPASPSFASTARVPALLFVYLLSCTSIPARGEVRGSIVGWGGQVVVPQAELSDLVAVTANYGHSLGLKADGSVVGWGNNSFGQCDVPLPNRDFIAIAAGGTGDCIDRRGCASFGHSAGLKSDGSVVAWGAGGCGEKGWPHYGQSCVPAPSQIVAGVAAGGRHCVALGSDGSILAWGHNDFGQREVPRPNKAFVAIAAGGNHGLVLKADVRGDLNCDGRVDFFDIDPFRLAMFDSAAYSAEFPACNAMNADINHDQALDFFDIDPFLECLFGGCP